MRFVIFFLIMLIVPKFSFSQEYLEEIDTLSLNDLYSKDIIIIGSKDDLLQKMGISKKIRKSHMWCFQEIKNSDTTFFEPKRINFTTYTYDLFELRYNIDTNDEVTLSMVCFKKGSDLTIVHPKLIFTSKLKLKELLKIFTHSEVSEEPAICHLNTLNTRKKAYVVRFSTGYSNCCGAATTVVFDSKKYLRVIYFNHFYAQ